MFFVLLAAALDKQQTAERGKAASAPVAIRAALRSLARI